MFSNIINVAVVIFFAMYLWRFFKITKTYFIVIVLHIFFAFWLVVSVAFIESGVYNKDLLTITYFNFSTLKLVFYEIVFFETVLFWYRRSKIKCYEYDYVGTSFVKERNHQIILLISGCYSIYAFLNMLISENTFTNSSVTRFNFYTTYSALPFAQVISYFAQPIALLLGFVLCRSRRRKRKIFSLFIFLLLIIANYGTGNEFGTLLYLGVYYITPIGIDLFGTIEWKTTKEWTKTLLVKYKKYIILVGIAFLAVCIIKIRSFSKVNIFAQYASTPFAAFLYRAFALQGDVWWAVDVKVAGGFNDIVHFFQELGGLFGLVKEQDLGINYLMKLILPQSSLDNYLWGNAQLMSGYPAINIAMFGYIGTIPVIILEATIFAKFSTYVYKKIIKQQYLYSFLAFFVYIQFLKIYNISGYHNICNIIPAVFIFLLIFAKAIIGIKSN